MDLFERKKRCYNGGFKHKFKTRYSEKCQIENIQGTGFVSSGILDRLKDKDYICDVCVWCGKVVKKL